MARYQYLYGQVPTCLPSTRSAWLGSSLRPTFFPSTRSAWPGTRARQQGRGGKPGWWPGGVPACRWWRSGSARLQSDTAARCRSAPHAEPSRTPTLAPSSLCPGKTKRMVSNPHTSIRCLLTTQHREDGDAVEGLAVWQQNKMLQ